ncbi:MAG: hypothetical protein KH359_10540 [Clostridiales bacterium]|nr:hypothetical protein [Clostridiales bacterium]
MKDKLKRWISLFLICVFCFSSTAAAASTEQETEEEQSEQKTQEILNRDAEMKKILQEVGVGVAKSGGKSEALTEPMPKETIYTQVLEKNIGAIDVIDYNDPNWSRLEHWNEGMLGSSSGEQLYCADPNVNFKAGYKTSVDARKYYNQTTIQMIAAMFYYYDHYMCSRINRQYDYLLKQCAVWWVLNEVHRWYGSGVDIETGNNVYCGCGGWMSTHKTEYKENGMAWAKKNYQYFTDAYGIIYQGEGQPVSKWGGKYNPTGTAKLKKESANPGLTNGNPCYSLAGAKFGVYSDPSLSGASWVGSFTTNANGESDVLTLNPGIYYVKELEAPPGFAIYPGSKPITVTAGKETTVTFADLPQMDPVGILLGKVDAETNQNKPQGSATLQGAQFTVKYYAGLWAPNVDPATLGQMPVRTWVFETDEDGYCDLSENYLLGGDEFYRDPTGIPTIPLGTVTIQETKAPEGYLINNEVYVVQITSSGTADNVHTYNRPVIPENILKLDLVKKQEGTDIVIPGAKFEHTKPDGTKEAVVTDENGELTLKGLQYTVRADNTIQNNTKTSLWQPRVDFDVTDEGNIFILMEDRLSPFELVIHKENNRDKTLSGAEFSLYSDKACQKRVAKGTTDEKGILRLEKFETGKTYYLQETKAPKGYRLPLDSEGNPVTYEIRTESTPVKGEFIFYVNGKAYTTASDPEGMFYVSGSKANREAHMTIENQIQMKLPETGSSTTMLLMIGAVISGVVAMFCMEKRKAMK